MISTWLSDPATVTTNYGDINTWDTSQITNMDDLFNSNVVASVDFNDDISNWNTSNVTSMKYMFRPSKMSIKKYKNDLLDIVDRTPIPGKNIINNYVSLYYN